MYNEEYDNDQEEQTNGSFIKNFYYNNKILVWIFCGIIVFILLMSLLTKGGSSSQEEQKNYDVVIEPEGEIVIQLGYSENLIASVKDNSAAQFSWSAVPEGIVKVDNGNVVGLKYGKAKVTATYIHSDDTVHSETRDVIVAEGDRNITLSDVSFKNGDLFMPLNSTYKIALNLTPTNAFVENKVFSSSNSSVVTVDSVGLVTAVGEGESTITVDVNNGKFTKDLRVYVDRSYRDTEIIITPEEISFDGELRKIKVGATENLSYKLTPSDADPDKLIWESSDESIVTVDGGKIKGIKEGPATITVSSVSGAKDKIDIEVESDIVQVSDINLAISDITLSVGQSQVLMPVVSPDNASNKALSFVTGDSSVASVSANETGTQATITAENAGYTTIVVSANNGVEKRLNVTVIGGSSSGGSSGGSSSGSSSSGGSDPTIVVRSADNNLSKSYSEVRNMYAKGPSTVTITLHSGVAKVKYCLVAGTTDCNPTVEMNGTGTITVPNGNIYMLCVKKYDHSGNEIASSSANYSNGLLHYYINTKGNGATANSSSAPISSSSTSSLYSVTGLYASDSAADTYPKTSASVRFTVYSNVGYILVCHSTTDTCTPTTKITSSSTFTLTDAGLHKFVIRKVYNNGTTAPDETKFVRVTKSTGGGTQTAAPSSSSVGSKPVITCYPNAIYTGQLRIIATCSNGGKFKQYADSSNPSIAKAENPGSYQLTCTNAYGTDSRPCTITKSNTPSSTPKQTASPTPDSLAGKQTIKANISAVKYLHQGLMTGSYYSYLRLNVHNDTYEWTYIFYCFDSDNKTCTSKNLSSILRSYQTMPMTLNVDAASTCGQIPGNLNMWYYASTSITGSKSYCFNIPNDGQTYHVHYLLAKVSGANTTAYSNIGHNYFSSKA